jgi:hypothetical protein
MLLHNARGCCIKMESRAIAAKGRYVKPGIYMLYNKLCLQYFNLTTVRHHIYECQIHEICKEYTSERVPYDRFIQSKQK